MTGVPVRIGCDIAGSGGGLFVATARSTQEETSFRRDL